MNDPLNYTCKNVNGITNKNALYPECYRRCSRNNPAFGYLSTVRNSRQYFDFKQNRLQTMAIQLLIVTLL